MEKYRKKKNKKSWSLKLECNVIAVIKNELRNRLFVKSSLNSAYYILLFYYYNFNKRAKIFVIADFSQLSRTRLYSLLDTEN